jgi:hypothetical protein
LVSRIARTVIVVSLKPVALLSERDLCSLESSINSSAPVSLQRVGQAPAFKHAHGLKACRITQR